MAWGMGGWLLFPFLQKIGRERANALKQRVVAELKTTFASHYSKEISLAEVLDLDMIAVYNTRDGGEVPDQPEQGPGRINHPAASCAPTVSIISRCATASGAALPAGNG
jgi:hypothetical protein